MNEKEEVVYTNTEDKKNIQPQEKEPEKKPLTIRDRIKNMSVFQKQETPQLQKELANIDKEFKNLAVVLTQITMRYTGISLITTSPFIIIFLQIGLAIREIALNTRKEYNSETEYKILYWIATILTFISFCMIPVGITLIIVSL